MKFTTTAKELKSAFSDVGELSTQVRTLPIFNTVFFKCDEDGIRVTGTNLELAVQVDIQGSIEKHGCACLPAWTLKKILYIIKPSDGNITIDASDTETRSVKIEKKTKYTLVGFDPDAYPHASFNTQPTGSAILSAEAFSDLLENTVYAMSGEKILRPEWHGVYFEYFYDESLKLRATAIDGVRVAICQQHLKKCHNLAVSNFIMPADAVKEAMRIFKESDEVTIIPFYQKNDENKHLCIQVEDGKRKLFSRAVDYSFPDWRSKVVFSRPYNIIARKAEILEAIRGLEVIARVSNQPYIIVHIKPSTLVLKTGGPGVEAQHTIHHYGSDISTRIGISVESLKDAISHIDGDWVMIAFPEPCSKNACVIGCLKIFSIDSVGYKSNYVMPRRLSGDD